MAHMVYVLILHVLSRHVLQCCNMFLKKFDSSPSNLFQKRYLNTLILNNEMIVISFNVTLNLKVSLEWGHKIQTTKTWYLILYFNEKEFLKIFVMINQIET